MPQNNTNPDTEPSLTQLCSICHLTLPKYTCPACFTRTCSLSCSQTHKRRAQCSGIRDPTSYVKRKDLATEKGFDADFNFLSGVERGIERAGRVVENRMGMEGLLGINGGEKKVRQPGRGEIPFLKAVEEGGVRLVRAPRGMERQRRNQSGWHRRHKCVNWFVEWVLPGGGREGGKALEGMGVGEAFGRMGFGGMRKGEDGEGERARKKRRVDDGDGLLAQKEELAPDETAPLIEEVEDNPSANAPPTTERSSRTVTPEIPPLLDPTPSHLVENIVQPSPSEKQSPKYHFYLHRPRSRSKLPVLIPLTPTMTLADALRGRTILEFPTIYVLEKQLTDPRAPEDGFVLEEEYLRENPGEREEEKEDEGEDGGGSMPAGLGALTGVDEKEVMKVLKRDLGE